MAKQSCLLIAKAHAYLYYNLRIITHIHTASEHSTTLQYVHSQSINIHATKPTAVFLTLQKTCNFFFQTRSHCGPGWPQTLQTSLAVNSETQMPLLPQCWDEGHGHHVQLLLAFKVSIYFKYLYYIFYITISPFPSNTYALNFLTCQLQFSFFFLTKNAQDHFNPSICNFIITF